MHFIHFISIKNLRYSAKLRNNILAIFQKHKITADLTFEQFGILN